jgi:hypothetical protein
MYIILGIIMVVGIFALLYSKATKDVLKEVGIFNPLTVSLGIIVLIALIVELLK